MTDQPYTADDLRTEAARQLCTAGEDPDFMGIGEQMDGAPIDSTFYDASGQRHENGRVWDQLDAADFEAAQASIADLINGAADVSDWAVDLGADGLEPEEHRFTLSAGPKPLIRVHFGFAPEMAEEARSAFVESLGHAAAREMHLALEENPVPTIPTEVAAHVLWTEQKGGWPPSTFAEKLLNLWTSADTANADNLAMAFPAYGAAIALLRSGEQGVQQLRAISGDS